MTRLSTQLRRLFAWPADVPAAADAIDAANDAGTLPFIAPDQPVRALMLALARPADWSRLGAVWRAVQNDLSWPAPAIAVSGDDGIQLWFSTQDPVPAADAHALLVALVARHLGGLPASRLTLRPAPVAAMETGAPTEASSGLTFHAALPSVAEVRPEQWSAFIAPDLAPIFADTPWLDLPPGDDNQADVLQPLRSIGPAQWADALAQLAVDRPPLALSAAANRPVAESSAPTASSASSAPPASPAAALQSLPPTDDPRVFLRRVMNDDTVPMTLRIEAAKALLAATAGPVAPSLTRGD